MSPRHLTIIGIVVLAVGCATPVPPPSPVLDYVRSNCATAPDLSAPISLTPAREQAEFDVSTSIDERTACIEQDGTPTPYVVFALPSDYADKTITVGAPIDGTLIFAANTSLLDSTGVVTRAITRDQFAYRGAFYSAQFRPHPGEAYLLVTADATLVGQAYNSITLGTVTTPVCAASCTAWRYGNETRQSSTFSFNGAVRVIVNDSNVNGHPAR